MAYQRYQGYQYETSPRKIQPEYEPIKSPYKNKKTTVKITKTANTKIQSKQQIKGKVRLVISIAVVFSVLLAICYQNSLITESFKQKETLKKNLGSIEKENEQLKVNIEKSLNLNNIEQSAKEKLGMQKLDNNQKVYINLPKQDYVESATEDIVIKEETDFWTELIKNITKIFK